MNELHLFAGAGGGILGGMLLGHTTPTMEQIDQKTRQTILKEYKRHIMRAHHLSYPFFSINEDDMETIKEMADFSYKRWINRGSVCGQMLTARDDYSFHIIIATENFIRQRLK